MKERAINDVVCKVYDSISEFAKHAGNGDAVVKNWREAEEDDWVLTDDEQVCQVLYKGSMQPNRMDRRIPYIRTLFGTFLQTPAVEIRGDIVDNIWSFSNRKKSEIHNKRTEPTRGEQMFAWYVARGLPPNDAYIKAFPTNKKPYATLMGQKLMKTERVQGAIRQEIEGLLDNAGVSKTELIKSANEIAGSADSDATRLRAIEYLLGLFGVSPKQEKKSESITLFQGFTKEQIAEIEASGGAEVKKIKASVDSG
jgi:hypothetical protein